MKFGSHLYGTDTPESDLDLKAIYLPTARQIVLGTYDEVVNQSRKKKPCERNNKDDVDVEIFSLDRLLSEIMDGQIWALDFLFAPRSAYTEISHYGDKLMGQIFHKRERLLTRNINAFVGYARKQAAKYGVKGTRMDALKRTLAILNPLPDWDRLGDYADKLEALVKECNELVSLEKTPLVEIVQVPGPNEGDFMPHLHVCGRKMGYKTAVKTVRTCYQAILDEYGDRAHRAHLAGGVDWKALSHAVRVNHEALELLQTGSITFPRPERELLVKIKTSGTTGAIEKERVYEMIEEGMVYLTEAHAKSPLREEPDRQWAEDFVYEVYSRVVRKG